ncbi:MAG: porphobilinogen synthase [Rhodothermales bacterium]|nr:porphobilinogen synthase [Rhodothermales bacterium]
MQTTDLYPLVQRPRRLRRTAAIRRMARETRLSADDLILPLFVVEGEGVREPIGAMPGQHRFSVDRLVEEVRAVHALGIPAVALFPKVPDALKDERGSEGLNPDGLFPRAIRAVKDAVPDLAVVSDVALDPYSSDGHDGLVRDGRIANDETLDVLAEMALVQAAAGADVIAPSDMMDGRVAAIRDALDGDGFTETAIMAYSAKYASAFYGPFRAALDSAPRQRPDVPEDKRTYQMDPANAREAIREVLLDVDEGADFVMVKPALAYLDVIHRARAAVDVPVAAYHVSGEYSMLHAAAERGWVDLRAAALEATTAIRRAGADLILTYFAKDLVQWLNH